jgi:D-serine deaminase-like pyridoxal phosphate-dependent protein
VKAPVDESELRELVSGDQFGTATTPAVVIDAERVRENIATTVRHLGSPRRWRPHVKTARTAWTVRALLESGVTRFKASTVSEVDLLIEAGARDVLLAYPAIGPTQWRLAELAAAHPDVRISVLADHADAIRDWRQGPLSVFLDVDTGGGRTGAPTGDPRRATALLDQVRSRGFAFGGLHSYDGHLADLPEAEQREAVEDELHGLAALAGQLEEGGHRVGEIVAGGSHTFIPGARTELPEPWRDRITFGPGTVVYNDLRSLGRFGDKGYRCAAFVVSRVISRQGERGVTVDAGLTTIQLDAGRPHARVIGFPAEVGAPSQEHLKLTIESGPVPGYGEVLLLVPRHIDTTLAQFDRVHLVEDGSVRELPTVLRPF